MCGRGRPHDSRLGRRRYMPRCIGAGGGTLPDGERMGASVRVFWGWVAIAAVALGCGGAGLVRAQAGREPSGAAGAAKRGEVSVPAANDPVADPKAVVTVGHARFTVLTPQLIRMEWSADGKFEDHASFVFINRRLPVPKFVAGTESEGSAQIQCANQDRSRCEIAVRSGRRWAISRPRICRSTLTVDGKKVVWHPGDADTGNLQGTTRTLDTARGIEDAGADRSGAGVARWMGAGG